MSTSTGFRAEEWNLASPLATCSLVVKRVDSLLYIQLYGSKPKPDGPDGATEERLFAQCKICLEFKSTGVSPKMDYWVNPTVDSSRYFVLRISDEKDGREAHIGIGFRERNDALNFKMSLDDYEKTMRKEAMFMENSLAIHDDDNMESAKRENEVQTSIVSLDTNLRTFKEGEKIHISIKGREGKPRRKAPTSDASNFSSKNLLLKKPPSSAPVANTDDTQKMARAMNTDVCQEADSEETKKDEDNLWNDFQSV